MKAVWKKQLSVCLLALLVGVLAGAPVEVATAVEVGAPAPEFNCPAPLAWTSPSATSRARSGCSWSSTERTSLRRERRTCRPGRPTMRASKPSASRSLASAAT